MIVRKFQIALLLALSLVIVVGAYAQTSTTGAIEGKVTDKSGAALPGVTLEIRSPNLQGTKTETTDANGQFRFNLLPPGTYSLKSSLSGFSPVQQQGILVPLAHTVTLDVKMATAVSETITVTAAAPVVDVKSTTTGQNITTQTMQSLPIGRGFVAAAQVAPGVQSDAVGPTVYGSSGAENSYIIDGLNTTSLRSGLQGKEAPVEFIQEVDVMTGGLPAEYGRMTGGTINAITKTGGNTYTGDVFGFDAPWALRADNKTFSKRPGTTTSVSERKQILDLGAALGGYFVKDRLWFFGAYDNQNRTDLNTRVQPLVTPNYQLAAGAQLDTKVKNQLYAGKLTLRITENQNLAASIFGDPTKTTGPIFDIAGPPSTFMGQEKTGGNDETLRYNGVFGTFLVDGEYGKHRDQDVQGGPGELIPRIIDQTVSPNVTSGGFGFYTKEKYNRGVYKVDLSKYFASHDLKIGGDYEDMKANVQTFAGGAGQRIYKLIVPSSGKIYYRHRYYVDDLAPGFDRKNPATWVIANPLFSAPETKNNSAYVQDSWRALSNLTINAGVRWESQEVLGRNNFRAFKINDNWAPRLGVVWDVQNNGRSKLYANYGRFFEAIPMDINIRSYGGEQICFCYNFSPDPANTKPDTTAPRRSSILGGGTEPVDPNLKGQHIDEYLAGYDYEFRPNLKIGIQGTYRKLGNVIEDMLVPSTGEYFIANPGSGIGREAAFYEGGTVVTPPAKRTYKGIEIHADKRFSNNYQFFASYLWSRLEGNYDGTFQASTGQLDPNINSAFDYADFIVNNHGLLSNDRTHQLKFYGSYQFPTSSPVRGLTIGLATRYASGVPLTATGYSFAYGNWEYYLTTRGALGRGPANYEADVHFGYPIPVGSNFRVNVIADIFNLLNLQKKTALDIRFNRIQDGSCGGFIVPAGMKIDDVCTSDGGLVAKSGTVDPVSAVNLSQAPNPDFLRAGTRFTDPRTVRLGVRVSF